MRRSRVAELFFRRASLIDIRGRLSRSLQSMITRVESPVLSSTFSSIVTASTMSPNLTVPPTSVSIGIVYGSHSAITWPS